MAEIVSLNKYRKARQRSEAENRAAENRIRHGRGKAERQRDADSVARIDKALDGKRIETVEDSDTPEPA